VKQGYIYSLNPLKASNETLYWTRTHHFHDEMATNCTLLCCLLESWILQYNKHTEHLYKKI